MLKELNISSADPLSIPILLLNLGVGVILSIALRWHFKKFGSTLSNREEFAQVFPFLLLTTILIITVVKSSLALSLGLVGALSIVRFRTPIKEPEELAYLFMAIAIGLGLGANQTLMVVITVPLVLGVMALLKWGRRGKENKNLFISIDYRGTENEKIDRFLENINSVILKHVTVSDLRRFDIRENAVEAIYMVDIRGTDNLSALVHDFRNDYPHIGVTFLDQNSIPGI